MALKTLDSTAAGTLPDLSADLRCVPASDLCTTCVQEGGFEGPENGPKQRRINNRLLSYRPQHRGETNHKYLIVQWLSVFRNCAESPLRYKTATSPTRLLCTMSESTFRRCGTLQPRGRQDVVPKLESAMLCPIYNRQTEPTMSIVRR